MHKFRRLERHRVIDGLFFTLGMLLTMLVIRDANASQHESWTHEEPPGKTHTVYVEHHNDAKYAILGAGLTYLGLWLARKAHHKAEPVCAVENVRHDRVLKECSAK